MLMVYFTIFDLPDEYASRVDSIFVVMAGRYNSIKSEGQEIFRRLVNDLKILEKGIVINGETVKAGLLAYCGDNLESHTVGGFQTHFHAGYVCRFCVINYKEIPEYVLSQYPHRWTKERYDELALDLSPPEESILELLEIEMMMMTGRYRIWMEMTQIEMRMLTIMQLIRLSNISSSTLLSNNIWSSNIWSK